MEFYNFKPGKPMPSDLLVDVVHKIAGETLLLSFSGRDSLATWLFLRDAGFQLIPYFCYTVPHLSYDDEALAYYEKFFQTHIIRLPHPNTYSLLRSGAYQPLDTWRILYYSDLPSFDFSDIEKRLAAQFGLGDNYLSAVGIRATDNIMRWRLIHQMGPIGLKKRRYYFAIWDWKTQTVMDYIYRFGAKLSKSYLYFGSTGDGIDYRFLRFLKDNLPDDYNRVLELFPMADIELFRYEGVK